MEDLDKPNLSLPRVTCVSTWPIFVNNLRSTKQGIMQCYIQAYQVDKRRGKARKRAEAAPHKNELLLFLGTGEPFLCKLTASLDDGQGSQMPGNKHCQPSVPLSKHQQAQSEMRWQSNGETAFKIYLPRPLANPSTPSEN